MFLVNKGERVMNIKSVYNINNQISQNWKGYYFETLKLTEPVGSCVVRIKTSYHPDINIMLIVDYKNGFITSYELGNTPLDIARSILNEYAQKLERGEK